MCRGIERPENFGRDSQCYRDRRPFVGRAAHLQFRVDQLRLLAQPAVRPQLSDEVVTAVSAGIARIQDHIGACIADGIHGNVYRQVNAREIADLAWSALDRKSVV